jgi:hypothetical protein
LLTNRDKMGNSYRGPSIDASYQVSVHLATRYQRRKFKKIGQSETRIVSVFNCVAYLKIICIDARSVNNKICSCHEMAEILLKLALNTNQLFFFIR